MYRLVDELKAFLESGVGLYVGTGDSARGPQVTRGWGFRVLDDRYSAEVFVDATGGANVSGALRGGGRIAVVAAQPTSYRSIQVKGRCLEVGPPAPGDAAWVQHHRDQYATATALIGQPPAVTRNQWTREVVRIRFTIEEAFDQTPGPRAGRRL